jgi:pimeloyl-ACP methyl ester carboxylesterase
MATTPLCIRSHVTLALFCLIVGSHTHAQVGPNGEVDGLTAKFVDVNGVRTRYYDYGQGETIVLVHGGGPGAEAGSANNWSRNIRALARKFRVLAIDRLAEGMTDAPKDDKDFGTAGQVEHRYQFIRAMKLDKVVGSSSAADNLTLALALEHPEIVKTLTWVSGGAAFRSGPSKFQASLAKCPTDSLSAEYQKCRMAARAPSPRSFSPDDEQASAWMWNLPKSVEIRKRLAAIRATGTQRG